MVLLKPSVTFFGEQLPKILFTSMKKDLHKCDLVLVIGTSLKVGGSVHEVLKGVDPTIPQILINRDVVNLPPDLSEGFDVTLLGYCDDICEYLCHRLGWKDLNSNNIPNENENENKKVDVTMQSSIHGSNSYIESVASDHNNANLVAPNNKRKASEDNATYYDEKSCNNHDCKWEVEQVVERNFNIQITK